MSCAWIRVLRRRPPAPARALRRVSLLVRSRRSQPSIDVSGVRSSWESTARKSSWARLAFSASGRAARPVDRARRCAARWRRGPHPQQDLLVALRERHGRGGGCRNRSAPRRGTPIGSAPRPRDAALLADHPGVVGVQARDRRMTSSVRTGRPVASTLPPASPLPATSTTVFVTADARPDGVAIDHAAAPGVPRRDAGQVHARRALWPRRRPAPAPVSRIAASH